MFWKNKSIKQMTTWKGEAQIGIMTHCKYNKELTQINFQKVSKSFAKFIKRQFIMLLLQHDYNSEKMKN